MTESERLGIMEGADDVTAAVYQQPDDPQVPGGADSQLWWYHNAGRMNGVPVAEQDRGLKIDDEGMLATAFLLERRLRSLMLYLSPDDAAASARYDRLLDLVNDGSAEIVDEVRQWDQEHSRFVLWVRYNELEYRLNPRFAYLREE